MPAKKQPLDARLKAAAASASGKPQFLPPPEPEEVIPDIRELVKATDATLLTNLVEAHADLGAQIKVLTKERDALTPMIKTACGQWGLGKVMCGGLRVNYYSSSKSTFNRTKLLRYLTVEELAECTDTTTSYNLRVTAGGGDDE